LLAFLASMGAGFLLHDLLLLPLLLWQGALPQRHTRASLIVLDVSLLPMQS
jgi:hypothetical protein